MTNNECNHLHVKITEIVIELAKQYDLQYVFSEVSSEWRLIMGTYPAGIPIRIENDKILYADDLAWHVPDKYEPSGKDKNGKTTWKELPWKPRVITIEDLKEKLIKRIEKQLAK
jgi:hypothetical protein